MASLLSLPTRNPFPARLRKGCSGYHHPPPRPASLQKELKKFIGVVYLIYLTVSFHRCRTGSWGGIRNLTRQNFCSFFLRSNPRDSNKKERYKNNHIDGIILDIKRCLKKSHSRLGNFSKNIKQRCLFLRTLVYWKNKYCTWNIPKRAEGGFHRRGHAISDGMNCEELSQWKKILTVQQARKN